MRPKDQTDVGGTIESFRTTQWYVIESIQKQQDPERVMIGILLGQYWKPVYCYLRRCGYRNEDAKDLTQGFFHEVVLGRKLVHRADQSKGRFRTFLLHALQRYMIDARRRQSARGNIPPEKLVSLDVDHPPVLPQTVLKSSPEECFLYAWKSAILERVLATVKAECLSSGQLTHWHVFWDHLVHPILEGTEPSPLKDLCRHYDIASERSASNMIITVKRRFQRTLREYLRGMVTSDTQANEELRDFLRDWPFGAQEIL